MLGSDGLGLAIRNHDELKAPLGGVRAVTDEESLAFQLDDVTLLEAGQVSITNGVGDKLGDRCQAILKAILLLELLLGDQVVVVVEVDGDEVGWVGG